MRSFFLVSLCLLSYACLVSAYASRPVPPAISPDLIYEVNSASDSSWVAGLNERFVGKNLDDAKILCGLSPITFGLRFGSTGESVGAPAPKPQNNIRLPKNFDAREQWGAMCPSLMHVPDQSGCGSCWAVAAASAITDRTCIASNGTITTHLSSTDVLSCCGYQCGGCQGGQPNAAWDYWVKSGVVSGGDYKGSGCFPYPMSPCKHGAGNAANSCGGGGESKTPACPKTCRNGAEWKNDKYLDRAAIKWARHSAQ
jgi:cathepsin B